MFVELNMLQCVVTWINLDECVVSEFHAYFKSSEILKLCFDRKSFKEVSRFIKGLSSLKWDLKVNSFSLLGTLLFYRKYAIPLVVLHD